MLSGNAWAHGPRLLALLLVLLAPAATRAQQEDDDGEGLVPPVEIGQGRGEAQDGDVNRIHIPDVRVREVRCREAAAAAKAGDWILASRIYLDILREERDPDQGVQGLTKVGARRWLSYARYARERLFEFPEAGRKAFRALADDEARALLDDAVRRRDRRDLETVWRTYPLAGCAGEALEHLGDVAVEAGEFGIAATRYDEAARLPGSSLDPLRLGAKLALVRAALARLAPPVTGAVTSWTVIGGNNEHTAALPPFSALGEVKFASLIPCSRPSGSWGIRGRRLPRFEGMPGGFGREGAFAEIIPVEEGDDLVVHTGNAIVRYDLSTGERRWAQQLWSGPDSNANIYASATIAGGRVFASFIKSVSPAEDYRGIPIKASIPARRLVAFDLHTGKRLWDHAESTDDFVRRVSVALPPVASRNVLYASGVVREGAIKCYVMAFDAATGRLIWKRFLGAGQIELTMFGQHAIEPLAMQPAEHAGTVYCGTAVGAFAAIAAETGEIQWLATYETIPIEAARTYYAVERELGWRNSPPICAGSTCVIAPLDSERAFAYDAATGEMRWAIERGSLRRLLGASKNRAIFQGDRLHAYDLRTGKLVLTYPRSIDGSGFNEEEMGRGLICGDVALVPVPSGIARVDLGSGERLADVAFPGQVHEAGSLLYTGSSLISVNPQRVTVFRVHEQPSGAPPGATAPPPPASSAPSVAPTGSAPPPTRNAAPGERSKR